MSWSMRDERVQTQLREYRGQGQLKEIGILLLGTIGITPLAIDVCTLWEKKKKALKKKKKETENSEGIFLRENGTASQT